MTKHIKKTGYLLCLLLASCTSNLIEFNTPPNDGQYTFNCIKSKYVERDGVFELVSMQEFDLIGQFFEENDSNRVIWTQKMHFWSDSGLTDSDKVLEKSTNYTNGFRVVYMLDKTGVLIKILNFDELTHFVDSISTAYISQFQDSLTSDQLQDLRMSAKKMQTLNYLENKLLKEIQLLHGLYGLELQADTGIQNFKVAYPSSKELGDANIQLMYHSKYDAQLLITSKQQITSLNEQLNNILPEELLDKLAFKNQRATSFDTCSVNFNFKQNIPASINYWRVMEWDTLKLMEVITIKRKD